MKVQSVLLSVFVACGSVALANEPARFDEVYKLLRENLPGATDAELNQAAVKGLINQLQPRASLASPESENSEPLVSKTELYDDSFGYIRVGRVANGLAEKIAEGYRSLSSSNKIRGVVLDLRFATGTDYQAAASAADLFVNSDQPLLDWGAGSARGTVKTNAISVPVAVMVNAQTKGAAEALAAVLRDANTGLLLGGTTAGGASVFKEFTLSDGSNLRIAVAPVKLGSGVALEKGLTPDIKVVVSTANEKTYFKDPYAVIAPEVSSAITTNQTDAATNRFRRRLNEAELVRQQREGGDVDDNPAGRRKTEPERPMINDPVLGRALDLLKGLAVVQQGSSEAKQRSFTR